MDRVEEQNCGQLLNGGVCRVPLLVEAAPIQNLLFQMLYLPASMSSLLWLVRKVMGSAPSLLASFRELTAKDPPCRWGVTRALPFQKGKPRPQEVRGLPETGPFGQLFKLLSLWSKGEERKLEPVEVGIDEWQVHQGILRMFWEEVVRTERTQSILRIPRVPAPEALFWVLGETE